MWGRMKTGDLGFLDGEGYLHLTGPRQGSDHPRRVNISPLEIGRRPDERSEVIEPAPSACRTDVRRGGGRLRRAAAGCRSAPATSCAIATPRCRRSRRRSSRVSDELPKTEPASSTARPGGAWTRGQPGHEIKDEPNNWSDCVLILALILVLVVIHWAGLPKRPLSLLVSHPPDLI